MCGIAGIFHFRDGRTGTEDHAEMARMLDHMAARGPDGAGEWRSGDGMLMLGHRRLAIIDLDDRANQPMSLPDGSLVVVFNGEIYNYRELRRELECSGAVFRTQSDTEVLLHLYRAYGASMVERLRGMFAFAIWDARERCLFLARDPFGIKPLYYADDGKTLRFASQVKTLLAGGALSSIPSPAGMAGFFLWGHVPEPWTWVKAVRALPAGSTLTVRQGAPVPAPRHYFDLREEIIRAEQSPPATGAALTEVVDALVDSVRKHLVADVPVGVFLSAGRDSNLIAALAARNTKERLRTLTLGFDEFRGRMEDEVPVAEQVGAVIGASHTVARITLADFEAERERLLSVMDQPSIDGVNAFFVSRAAATTGLKVVLSGLGGDELFGGYSSFTEVPRLARALRAFDIVPWFGRAVRGAAAPLARRLGKPKAAGLLEYGTAPHRAYLLRRALFMPWELTQVVDPPLVHEALAELAVEDNLRSRIAGIRNPALAVMALEMSCYMRNQLLRDADWAGMAHSLEIRVPLVDVELLRRWLPFASHHLPFDRQRIIQAVAPDIARIIASRPKTGFGVPVQSWLEKRALRSGRGRISRSLRPWARAVANRFAPEQRTMRVIALLTDAYGGIGGIAKFNRDVLAALDAMPECREIEAFPRLVQREPEPIPPKVRYRLEAARGKVAYVGAVLRTALDGRTADIVLCGHVNLLPLAWVVSRIKQCPLVLFVHGVEVWQPHPNRLTRILLSRVDCLAAVSRVTAERLAGWSGFPLDCVRILPNCVNLAAFSPRPRNEAFAGRLGIANRRVLLTVGRLADEERYKGFDEVLEVLPELARENADLVYVIVGDGTDRARLEAKARKLGVAERVVFTGYVSEEEKKDLYALADAYVMPSRGEGFGIVFLEAMAMGVPAIGSLTDGSREALLDGKLGQLVDPDDRHGLIQAIRTTLQRLRGRPAGLEYFGEEAFRNRVANLVRDTVWRERA